MLGMGIGVGGAAGAGGTTSGAGTNNTIPKFSGASSIVNSSITDNGTNISLGESVNSYNGITLAGQGLTPVVAFAATTPTTPVTSTNILASAPAGLYRATVYYVVTTAGVGGTAITVNVTYTDAQQAQTNSSITSSGLVLGQFAQGTLAVQQNAVGNIAYTVTETGTFTTHPVLAFKVALERVQ